MIETNIIKEIHPGHFQVILDFPNPKDLINILDESIKYVWVIGHNEGRSSWKSYTHSLYDQFIQSEILNVRNVKMEFLIDTRSFLNLVPHINQTVHIIQTDLIPPHYIQLDRLKGKQKYELLKDKLDYALEIEIPGASDFAPLVSPNKAYLKKVIENFKLDSRESDESSE